MTLYVVALVSYEAKVRVQDRWCASHPGNHLPTPESEWRRDEAAWFRTVERDGEGIFVLEIGVDYS
jgi:hypothetical protein